MRLRLCIFIAAALFPAPAAFAEAEVAAGLESADGTKLPILSSDCDAVITGDIATVRVTQTFFNSSDRPLHARYLFPLPHGAAVHAVTLKTKDEVVRAQIARIEEAKQKFEAAKQEGKTAALLEEHRANVFTQDVANVPPSEPVTIEIEYAESIPREDGLYVFHFPMAVGTRYENGAHGISVPALEKPMPAVERIPAGKAAGGAASRRVRLRVDLRAGLPVEDLKSPSHAIEIDTLAADHKKVFLASGKVVDDRDFVLKYRLAGERPSSGLVLHEDQRGAFFSMLIEPPQHTDDGAALPRELVFVLDASCSMSGEPILASKRLVEAMLDHARPSDTIRVIHFGSDAREFSKEPLPATRENLGRARTYVASIAGQGGTEVELGIKAALSPPIPDGRIRLVIFLTDGFIGNEGSVMATVHQYVGDSRIYAYGIGNGTNRWLLEEMAAAGRGVARIVGLEESEKSADAVADDLEARLRSPVLTDLYVDWGDLEVSEVTPRPLPDLFAGAPIRVLGRLQRPSKTVKPGRGPVLVGSLAGKTVRIPIALDLDGASKSGALPVLWARAQIADRMRALTRPQTMRGGAHDAKDEDLIEQITRLGLDFAITTRWTAFIAVAKKKVDADTPPISANVPIHEVHGAFGGASPTFGSSPEPAEWAALVLILGLSALVLRKRASC